MYLSRSPLYILGLPVKNSKIRDWLGSHGYNMFSSCFSSI